MDLLAFDRRPIVVVIAGPNGAGKTTFYQSQLAASGLRFVNADQIAEQLSLSANEAARVAGALRETLVACGESFVFETVLSDPVGERVEWLAGVVGMGHEVVMCFIGLHDAAQSTERVAMRVSQGGHDVPDEKLAARLPRTLKNLNLAIIRLPHVLVFDNSDLNQPYRLVAAFDHGKLVQSSPPLPTWLTHR